MCYENSSKNQLRMWLSVKEKTKERYRFKYRKYKKLYEDENENVDFVIKRYCELHRKYCYLLNNTKKLDKVEKQQKHLEKILFFTVVAFLIVLFIWLTTI